MSHIFNPNNFKKLDSPERRRSLPPDIVISYLNLHKGQTIADVGCGIGYFSFPLADAIGSSGKVKAVDISDIMIQELRERIYKRDYQNIEVYKSTADTTGIEDSSVDIFFTATLLHELNDLENFTEKAVRALKYNGKVAFLDFKKIDTKSGPPVAKRISADDVIKLFKNLGLMDIKKFEITDTYYLIIGKKRK